MPRAIRTFCHLVFIGAIFFSIPVSAQSPAPAAESTAEAWVKYGREKGANGDMNGAISNFKEALKADPNYAPAYLWLARAVARQDKLDEVIDNDTKAIALDSTYKDAYYDRGVAQAEKGNFKDALADFNKAIELDPKYALAIYNRGHIEYFNGDLDAAISDLGQAIALDPNGSTSYFIRGLARLRKDDREGAITDFQQSAVNGYPDATFWVWIAKTKMGDSGIARSDLSDALGKPQIFKSADWPAPIGNFLLEKMSQDELLAKAKESGPGQDHLCEAWFYIGVSKRFSGDTKGAMESFQQALATNVKISEMYIEAQRELASLQNH